MTTSFRKRPKTGINRKASKKRKQVASPLDAFKLQQRRMRLVGGLVSFMIIAVICTCGYLQGCEGELFLHEAERNYVRTLRLDTQRGDIYDRNGEALASSVEVDTIYANPRKMNQDYKKKKKKNSDPIAAARALSEVLRIDRHLLEQRLTSNRHFVYIKRQITSQESNWVQSLELNQVHLTREAKRFYPKKELAGQLLGIVGVDSRGQEGLEATYDSVLHGGRLEAIYHRDVGKRSSLVEGLPPMESQAGHSLMLTLDEKIQTTAKRELERAVISSLANSGIAIVMDVPTGDVLALAHYPRFNPNRYREQLAEDPRVVKNRAFTDQYEPGSTFKVFTMAAGLEEGVIGLDDTVDTENGRYKIGRHTIRDHTKNKKIRCRDIIKYSSNIGITKVAEMVGKERMYEYYRAFGFGERTGVNIIGDVPGVLHPANRWADITLANVAFGHGVAVTAMQMVTALATLGRGGLHVQPRLVMAEIDTVGKTVQEFPPQPGRRVVSVSTARQVIETMKGVTDHDGTGYQAWMYDYEVAGKTGTAHKPDTIAGGYAEDRFIASFFGLVPANRPRLAILVIVDEPKGSYYGGVVAAPAFKKIAEWSLNYLGTPPSFGKRERIVSRARKPTRHPTQATTEGAFIGGPDGTVSGTDPLEPLSVFVPDFRGLSVREAAVLAQLHHLMLDIEGNGVATSQAVPAETPLDPWSRVTVYFEAGENAP